MDGALLYQAEKVDDQLDLAGDLDNQLGCSFEIAGIFIIGGVLAYTISKFL